MLVTRGDFVVATGMIEDAQTLSYDVETNGLDPYAGDRIIGIAVRAGMRNGEHRSYYFPFRHDDQGTMWETSLNPKLIAAVIKSINKSYAPVAMFNAPFDLAFTWIEGYQITRPVYDVMVAAHINNENEPGFALKLLATRAFGEQAAAAEIGLTRELDKRGLNKGQLAQLPPEIVEPYATGDVDLTYDLMNYLIPRLRKQELYNIWLESGEYTVALADMMFHGILLDREKCENLQAQAKVHLESLIGEIRKITEIPTFNPRSPKQVQKYLGISSSGKTALAKIADPVAAKIREYRQWSYAVSSYYSPFLRALRSDGRIHCRLNQIGTVSGRLSASSPNMLGVARENEQYQVRQVIVAPPGYSLLSIDYSQIELRLLAYYTQSPFLIDVYRRNLDLHQATADYVHIDRHEAKITNFSASYGIQAESLSENLNCSLERAQEILDRYHGSIPEINRLAKQLEAQASRNRYIQMWTGRRRHFGYLDEYRTALNNTIQGGVGEIMRKTITRLHKILEPTGVRMILQVHDELLFEGPTEELQRLQPNITRVMRGYKFRNVPILTEAKIGPNWGQMVKIDE